MSNIIDSIRLSGVTYTLSAETSGGNNVVELTQAQYDALVTGGTVDPTAFYIITDATAGDLTQYWTSAQTQSAITSATSGKVDSSSVVSSVTSASTDSEIPTAKAVFDAIPTGGTGGGKAISAGTNISVTTGETADTVSCTLPITLTKQRTSIYGDSDNLTIFNLNKRNEIKHTGTTDNIIIGHNNNIGSNFDPTSYNFIFGNYNNLNQGFGGSSSDYNFIVGEYNTIGKSYSENVQHTALFGTYLTPKNNYEYDFGKYNNSVSGSSTFGDSGNTLFSVGNGTADNARHNAFEIRQNGDIYITLNDQDVKLQDQLGGGGGVTSGEVQTMIDDGISGKADTSAVTAVQDSLSGYVTTNTAQDITGNKTFIGSADTSKKPIIFKQANNSHKIGFICQNSASTNNELATFEFRPDTYTDSSSVKHPLLYLGHYRNNNTANAGVVQTMVGFRQYDQQGAAAYHYLMPLPAEAKTPFSLTTSFKNYFAPLGFKNGSTMITTDNRGVADFSDVLGGLKLVKLSQSEYDGLTTKDDNTVYFVGDSTNGYTMKLGSANVN